MQLWCIQILLGNVECFTWSEIPPRSRGGWLPVLGMWGCACRAAPAFLLAFCVGKRLRRARRELCEMVLALFSEGEASRVQGLFICPFFCSNSIPGYFLNVISFVLVSPKQPCCSSSCCSVVNSEIEFVQHSSLCRSAAVWDKRYWLHGTSTIKNLAGARRVFHSAYSAWGIFRATTIFRTQF